MPVDTIFLKRALENCLGRQIQVRRLFNFLGEVMNSPSQKESLSAFLKKWEKNLPKASRGMMIVSYVGTWVPNCLSQKELTRQKSWTEFARGYVNTYKERDEDNRPDYQPLNFKELIMLSFWKELYEQFGQRIVAYLFDKCAILFEVDEGLYLLVGYSKGIVHRKFSNFERKYNLNKAKVPSTATQTQPPRRGNFENPYEVKLGKDDNKAEVGQENVIQLSDDSTRKRRREASISRVEKVPGLRTKRIKLDDEALSENSGCNRWIRPRPDVLQKLIDLRNAKRKAANIEKDCSQAKLNFVGIQKDNAFKPTDKTMIIKQAYKICIRKRKVPGAWKGLELPDDLPNLANTNGLVETHTYIISETLAREVGIRCKPKGRQRKKGSQNGERNHPPLVNTPVTEQTASKTENKTRMDGVKPAALLDERAFANMNNITRNISQFAKEKSNSVQNLTQGSGNSLKPYFPDSTLSIVSCLYNNSSWSKWPTSHCLSKAAMLYNQHIIGSIKEVADGILKQPTCSSRASEHLLQSINSKWKAGDESNPLNKLFLDVIHAHSRFKDIHRLHKNCITYWRRKYFCKQEKKDKLKSTKTRKKKNSNEDKASKDADITEKAENRTSSASDSKILEDGPEIIDLTESTASTHYSENSMRLTSEKDSRKSPEPMDVVDCAPALHILTMDKSIQVHSADLEENPSTLSERKNHDLLRKCSDDTIKKRSYKKLNHPVPYNCVMQSLKQIMHIMKIDQLLGSKRNVRGFFKFVRKALILGGTKSSLHLSELMAMINLSDIPIKHVTDSELVIEIFTAKLVTWLFNEYVLVLLRISYYITECSHTRMQMNFYLREAWVSASRKMKSHLLENGALNILQRSQSQYSQPRPNVILRYIPKRNNSLRPLVSVRKVGLSLTKDESAKINGYLHYIDAKINKTRMYLPTTLQHEWRKFYSEWKSIGSPKLYYLRMDIRDAYPSVNHDKLISILEEASGGVGHKLVRKRMALLGSNGIKRVRETIFDERNRQSWHSGVHVRPCIAMDLENDMEIYRNDKILEQITSHIKTKNIVKSGKNLYEFHYGLPQGSSQSPILCNIYYGHIDSLCYLPFLKTHGRLFLRLVDDYLFVSPDPNEVSKLIQLMKITCGTFNIKMNEEKSETNVFVRSNVPTPTTTCEQVTFCGWAFCVTCGHVSRDFQKYSGQDFCSTISFQMPNNFTSPEQFLRLRGTIIVPARIKPILLDPSINCYKRIILTVFEAAVGLSFRFYAICRVIYPNLDALKDEERVKAAVSCIHLVCTRLATYSARNAEYRGPTFSSQEKASCGANSACCGNQNHNDPLTSAQTSARNTPAATNILLGINGLKYVAFYGFRLKLLNHHEVFKKVLPCVNKSLAKLGRNLGAQNCDTIEKIVGTKLPPWALEILI